MNPMRKLETKIRRLGDEEMTQTEEMFFSKEQVLKEKAEKKDKWVSPTLVKEKLGGKVKVTIIHHKNTKRGIRLILQTGKSSGGKLTSTFIKEEALGDGIMNTFRVKDYKELHGKKLSVTFVIKRNVAYVNKIKPLLNTVP